MITTRLPAHSGRVSHRLAFLLLASLALLTAAPSLLTAAPSLLAVGLESIYFGEFGISRINRMNPDGTGVTAPFGNQGGIDELDVDSLNGKVYWTNLSESRVRRANLDGSNPENVALAQNGPAGIALDPANGHVYWASFSGLIQRANLDGSDPVTIFTSTGTQPDGLALDLVNGHIYFANRSAGFITRINLDGSNPQNLLVPLNGMTGIAVNPTTQKIYFGSLNTPGLLQMNYDGTGLVAVVNNGGSVGAVSLDLENGHVYFGGNSLSAVLRCDLDGTNLITLASQKQGVFGIGLLRRVNRNITSVTSPAPGVSGATFRSFSQPVANRTGRVAFTGKLNGSITPASDTGIWTTLGRDTLTLLVQEGGITPIPGANILAWSALHIADNHLVFRAKLTGPAVTPASDDAIFVWNGTALSVLAREGDPSPLGGTWGPLGLPSVNAAGQVLFRANSTTPTGKTTGLFRSAAGGGTIEAIAFGGSSVELDGETLVVKSFTESIPNAPETILAGNGYLATILKLADGRTVLAVLAQ